MAGTPRKSSQEQKQRKVSIVPTTGKFSSKPDATNKMPMSMASSRCKRLYRFKRNYSDGYSESDPEDWFKNFKPSAPTKKIKKVSKKLKADKIVALSKLLKGRKTSNSTKVPEVIVEDFSKRRDSIKINKVKLKALSSFIDLQRSKNKVVDVIEVPKEISNKSFKNKASSVAKLTAFNPKKGEVRNPIQEQKEHDSKKSGILFNRTKLLAITSFTKKGKKEDIEDIQYVEVENSESESEDDEIEEKGSFSPDSIQTQNLKVEESKVKEPQETNSKVVEHKLEENTNVLKLETIESLQTEEIPTPKVSTLK